IIDKSAKFTVSNEVLSECLRYGQVRVFAFNYLDYLLWKDTELLQETKSKFRFSFKSSVEHFSPQTSRVNEILSETDLHGFGNLCLMSISENSSLSNDTPKQKAEILESQRNKMAPLSLKLELMIATLGDKLWNDESIKAHKNKVFEVLKEDIESAL
ncbi:MULTISPECIES: GmrSD restriction endonuclease domain-containing protein, partial [unclassified Psychrobacter]